MRKDRSLNPSECRAAFVGVYGIACGISTYSEALWKETMPLFREAHIFAEVGEEQDSASITHCWKRGESLGGLMAALDAYGPDVIFVQHEYGIFPDARHWLAFMSHFSGKAKVIVTLHSVYEHRDKIVMEAACHNIVVHTELARECLERKGIGAPIHVLPHGANELSCERLWNIYRSPHTLLQFGFGFRYKGWETSLRVVAELKREFRNVFFTGLVSRSPFSGTDADLYLQELHALVADLGLQENVALLSGFQSESVLDSFFRTNAVGIFPYKDNGSHTVYACSGAARRAMASGLVVVTSDVPLFSDISGVVPQPSSIRGFADILALYFTDKNVIADQRKRQGAFLEEISWKNIAQRYANLVR